MMKQKTITVEIPATHLETLEDALTIAIEYYNKNNFTRAADQASAILEAAWRYQA